VPPEVLLITGAAGVGKSTVSWEVGDELKRRGLAHAVMDTDELDRVWPLDLDDPRRRSLNVANLTAWWSGYRELGIDRLVLVGVFILVEDALDWIGEALPGAEIRAVRLVASPDELRRRVERREIGSGFDAQLARTLRYAEWINQLPRGDEVVFDTDDASVEWIAVQLCDLMGWERVS
jgi:hypothetical protein